MLSANHYYQDTRFVTFKAESTHFCVPLAPLMASCPGLGRLVYPAHQEENVDGVLCEVKSATAAELETFFDYLFPGPANPPNCFSIDELEVILKLSDIYEASAGRLYAITRIADLEADISAAKLLRISVQYNVPRWFKSSYQALVSNPLHAAEPLDLCVIPPPLLHRLLVTRHQVDSTRWSLAVSKPEIYHSKLTAFNCRYDGRCVDIMISLWDETAQPMLSMYWYSGEKVLKALLRELAEADICTPCRSVYELNFESLFRGEADTIERDTQAAFDEQGFTEDD